jgi:hypothetical protein
MRNRHDLRIDFSFNLYLIQNLLFVVVEFQMMQPSHDSQTKCLSDEQPTFRDLALSIVNLRDQYSSLDSIDHSIRETQGSQEILLRETQELRSKSPRQGENFRRQAIDPRHSDCAEDSEQQAFLWSRTGNQSGM